PRGKVEWDRSLHLPRMVTSQARVIAAPEMVAGQAYIAAVICPMVFAVLPRVPDQARCMCGRYLITSSPDTMKRLFLYPEQPNFPARYNVAPTQPVPIVRMFEGKRQFALVRWGLIPSWVKDPKGFSLLIQARAESILDKPAFRNAMKRRRCLFPADGFYDWKESGTHKQPYAVR